MLGRCAAFTVQNVFASCASELGKEFERCGHHID
jgi:hypothetical protein